ncbi:MAG TPA: DUF4082 domain-containing protein [Bryobacteraceae bacterium]|nr:DUF4082 domain-containing protein [Bryobacteraceae bacterium]
MHSFPKLLLLAATSLLGAQLAVCDSLYSFTSANQTFFDAPATLGFVFTANSSFQVDSLGWFDATGEGFSSQHTIGLFDSAGTLLASTTLSTSTSDTIDGGFRYHSIAPITLTAGSEYTLAGTSGGPMDSWTVNDLVNDFAVNPAFTIGPNAARFSYGTELVDPDSHFSDYLVYSGPNLEGQELISATPEPASFLLVAIAASILLISRQLRTLWQLGRSQD